MQNRQNLIWLGATGCGKTGLATSFLLHAIEQGYSGRYVLIAELIAELCHSVGDHSETKVLKKYLAFDCLLIDEIGYVEVEPVQVGLFFALMHQRHKKNPTLLTSNLGFAEWSSFLKNDHLTAALIDRLTENILPNAQTWWSAAIDRQRSLALTAPIQSWTHLRATLGRKSTTYALIVCM